MRLASEIIVGSVQISQIMPEARRATTTGLDQSITRCKKRGNGYHRFERVFLDFRWFDTYNARIATTRKRPRKTARAKKKKKKRKKTSHPRVLPGIHVLVTRILRKKMPSPTTHTIEENLWFDKRPLFILTCHLLGAHPAHTPSADILSCSLAEF